MKPAIQDACAVVSTGNCMFNNVVMDPQLDGTRSPREEGGICGVCDGPKKAEADTNITRVARISKAAPGGQAIEEKTKSVTTIDKNSKPVTTTTTTKTHAPPQ